jgi:hypothetical protein
MSEGSTPRRAASAASVAPSPSSARSAGSFSPFRRKWRRSISTLVIMMSPVTRTLWVWENASGGATWLTTFGLAGSRTSMIDVPCGGFMCPT